MEHKVIKDFLPEMELKALEHIVFGNKFHWFFCRRLNENQADHDSDFFFHRVIFVDERTSLRDAPPKPSYEYFKAPAFSLFESLIKRLKIKTLLRIHVNLFVKTPTLVHHTPHKDQIPKCRGAIFSLNTCDGMTRLENKICVPSVRNQMLLFNPSQLHNSTSTTNKPRRLNINFNWYDD